MSKYSNKKPIILFALLCFLCNALTAQNLTVTKFSETNDDLEAFLEPVKDINNENCALIKVVLGNIDIKKIGFETKGGIEVTKIVDKPSIFQKWVYVSNNTLGIRIFTQGYGNIAFYEFPNPVKSNKTYLMELITDEQLEPKIKKVELKSNTNKIFDDIIESEMVFVQGGKFTMGHNNNLTNKYDKKYRNPDINNEPEHEVELNDFYIGKYEVTQQIWKKVMGENPSYKTICDKCPVNNISWNDCQDFTQKLNELTGEKYRLPTEAEWEYAANSGNKNTYQTKYAGSDYIDDVAWYFKKPNVEIYEVNTNSIIYLNDKLEYKYYDDQKSEYNSKGEISKTISFIFKIDKKEIFKIKMESINADFGKHSSTHFQNTDWEYTFNFSEILKDLLNDKFAYIINPIHIVGTKKPNKLEIFDLTGNVAEFCMDYFGKYTKRKKINPIGEENNGFRVLRGGSVNDNNIDFLQNFRRKPLQPSIRNYGFGLRLVK